MTCREPRREPFAPLPFDTNKYTRGKLVLVVGSAAYTGAAVLAACAAERMGAGYTEVITVPEAVDIVRNASPSLVVRERQAWKPSALQPSTESHPCAVGVGSGFEGASEERALTLAILKEARCPVLVDGKALDYLGDAEALELLAWREQQHLPTVLTPHGGEAARLAEAVDIELGMNDSASDATTASAVDAATAATALATDAAALAAAYHALVVLKGPDTFISDGTTTIPMTLGTPALAKAGTGDVLAGMIASLLAQGIDPMKAAEAGATVHALAGREAAHTLTETAVIAGDLARFIPVVLARKQTSSS